KPYARLDALGRQLVTAALDAAKAKGIALQAPQCGSMLSLFFTEQRVRNLPSAMSSDSALFKRFFHACLERGVYLPPSAYEAWFLSTAHEGAAIDRACEVIAEA